MGAILSACCVQAGSQCTITLLPSLSELSCMYGDPVVSGCLDEFGHFLPLSAAGRKKPNHFAPLWSSLAPTKWQLTDLQISRGQCASPPGTDSPNTSHTLIFSSQLHSFQLKPVIHSTSFTPGAPSVSKAGQPNAAAVLVPPKHVLWFRRPCVVNIIAEAVLVRTEFMLPRPDLTRPCCM